MMIVDLHFLTHPHLILPRKAKHLFDLCLHFLTHGAGGVFHSRRNGVKIISFSGGGLPYPTKDKPKFLDKMIRFIMKVAVPKDLSDAVFISALNRQKHDVFHLLFHRKIDQRCKVFFDVADVRWPE